MLKTGSHSIFMKTLKIVLNNTLKLNNMIYFLLGFSAFLIKNVTKLELAIAFFVGLILINLLRRFLKLSFSLQSLLKHLNWILIPLLIYSFFLDAKVIGLLMIAHFFSDTIARIARTSFSPLYKKYLPKDINGTLFFVLSYFILSLAYIYFFHGFIYKKYIPIFFINSLVLGLLENGFKIKKYPDNFNINIFGAVFIYLSMIIKLSPTIYNPLFGLLICIFPILLLIFFDIINLKTAYKYYLVFILLYTGFTNLPFLFNVFILAGMGVVKKIYQFYTPAFRYDHSYVEISEIKEYFIISVVLVFIYYFIPYGKRLGIGVVLKGSMAAALITALLHYFYIRLNPSLSKKYYYIKGLKISREMFLFNMAISILFLLAAYFMQIINPLSMLIAFLIINIIMIFYMFLESADINTEDNRLIKYLLPYFSFKIFFLFQLL